MPLSTYCDPDEVRAALGVNSLELTDSTLALPVYEIGVVRELNKISSALGATTTLAASFSSIRDTPITSWTALQKNLYDSVRYFAVYQAAALVGVALANFAPKSVSDGKASVTRSSGETHETVMENVGRELKSARAHLTTALQEFLSGAPAPAVNITPTLAVASPRLYDPVVGTS